MKKYLLKSPVIFLPVLLILIISCDKDEVGIDPIQETDTELAVEEEDWETAFENMDNTNEDAFDASERSSSGRYHNDFLGCATLTANLDAKTFTIDFGDGCTGEDGRVRKGKIVVTYTGRHIIPGSVVTTKLENFYVDEVKIEGTRTVTNVSEQGGNQIMFNVKLDGGKITWPDGTSATREVNRTKQWIRAILPANHEFKISGTAEGITRKGKEYKVTITEDLLLKRKCAADKVFIPVDGTKEILINQTQKLNVDYGDGTCDNIITISKGDQSKEVDFVKRK